MDEPINHAVTSALDAAIADAATSAFARRTAGWDENRRATTLQQAFHTLHEGLRQLQTPDYQNPLVPILYALWYQPFQINLAYAAFRRIAHDRGGVLTRRQCLQVLDFGCGALATQFGICLAALDLALDGRPVPQLHIDLVDDSDAMIDLGAAIWQRFANPSSATPPTLPVSLPDIKTRRIIDTDDAGVPVNLIPNSERWLVALHALYPSREDAVKSALARWHARAAPSLALLTCHHRNAGLAQAVSPFPSALRNLEITPLPLTGDLPLVTRLRQQLLRDYDISDPRGNDPVQWNPDRGLRDNIALIYDDVSNRAV